MGLDQRDYCGLHYETKEPAEACYQHRTTHHACSLDIIRHSVERRPAATAGHETPPGGGGA